MKHFILSLTALCFLTFKVQSQEIELFQQFNGRYNYLAIGNTLNSQENNGNTFCETLEASSAVLTMPSGSTIISAYLYWAGSGPGDFDVTLNGIDFTADNTYWVDYEDTLNGTLPYFSCYKDITDFIVSNGSITYELSNLDISNALATNPGYCNNRTNFAGWSIYVIYQDDNLPLNQVSLFQGLEIINRLVPEKTIVLDNLNVLDNENAKLGFLAWEGDNALNYGESISINNNVLSNPPLNLADNAFNGTNSFTNSTTFFNCDLDVYNIQNNIAIGDTSAIIKMTTGGFDSNGIYQADLIILNNLIVVLNSQLPDATIVLDQVFVACGSHDVEVDYTVFNTNCTDPLPANTPIAFYANSVLVGTSITQNIIPIDGFESGSIILNIPDTIGDTFTLQAVVDDTGDGSGVVTELNELNNAAEPLNVELLLVPPITTLEPLTECDLGFNTALYDLTQNEQSLDWDSVLSVEYYESLDDLTVGSHEILIPYNYQNISSPQTIYLKLTNSECYEIAQFDLLIEKCPPLVPQGFSPNDDGYNDWFNIQGLYDIFTNHKLLIYNRYGTLIFEGNNDKKWYGRANRGLNNLNKPLPVGTYYYVLYLNSPGYKPLAGWVYLNR